MHKYGRNIFKAIDPAYFLGNVMVGFNSLLDIRPVMRQHDIHGFALRGAAQVNGSQQRGHLFSGEAGVQQSVYMVYKGRRCKRQWVLPLLCRHEAWP